MENDGSEQKTIKAKRVLSEKQLETLRLGREKWMERRRELKSQKMLTIDPQKKKYDEDKARVEAEINKIRREIEDKLRSDYDNKLSAIKEEYESKFSAEKAKELATQEIKVKYTKKPKKIIEVYSTEQDTDTDVQADKPKFPIAMKRGERGERASKADDINKFFF